MTRRALFAALASLPFVGRWIKKAAPTMSGDWEINGDAWHRVEMWNDGSGIKATVDGREVDVSGRHAMPSRFYLLRKPDGPGVYFASDE